MTTQLACDIYCLLVKRRRSDSSRVLSDSGLPQGKQTNKRFFIWFFPCSVCHLLSVRATFPFCRGPVPCAECPLRQCYLPFVGLRAPYTGLMWSTYACCIHDTRHYNVIKRKSFRLQLCVNVASASLKGKAHPRTGRDGSKGEHLYSFFKLGARCRLVVKAMHEPLYSLP